MSNQNNSPSIFAGLVMAVLTGAGLSLLLKPQSQTERRLQLRDKRLERDELTAIYQYYGTHREGP